MVRLVKEQLTKKHRYDEDARHSLLVETVEQYHYDSAETKEIHKGVMEAKGFEDSGQVKENIGTFNKTVFVWFGSYYKYEVQ